MKYTLIALSALLLAAVIYGLANNYDLHHHHDDHHHGEEHHEPIVAKEPVRADGVFSITTSFYPLQFALERIVSDLGVVNNIGEGKDPHDYEPTTQDILTLQQSDLVVLQGAEFEPWGNDVMTQLRADGVPVALATAELSLHEGGHHHEEDGKENEGHGNEHEHEHGAFDPHTWLDPILFSQTIAYLTEVVATLDPDNASVYEANATALKNELAALDEEYKNRLSECTLNEVITSHDAFSYLAERYGFTTHSIAGLSTQDTPSVTTLAELKAEAEEGISAILLEENSVAAYGETLARETGLITLSINPIAYVVPAGDDFLSLMRKNLDAFATALQCNE